MKRAKKNARGKNQARTKIVENNWKRGETDVKHRLPRGDEHVAPSPKRSRKEVTNMWLVAKRLQKCPSVGVCSWRPGASVHVDLQGR